MVDALKDKGDKLDIGEGALVAMTPDGVVRALVGGKNYGDSQFNRAVDAKRQPGSAFKPFVYLTALEHGLTPDTVREDAPIAVKGWKPENFEHKYLGPVTLTQALANSLNTVSVRLTLEFGPDAVMRTAYRLGITSQLRAQCLDRARHLGSLAVRAGVGLRDVRQWRARDLAACRRAHPQRRRQDALRPLAGAARPHRRRPLCRDDERDDARDVGLAAPRAAPTCPAGRPPARPAPARIIATPGSSATPRISSPASGSAMTTIRRPSKAVGGGLPVEIWSRFMRIALHGVAPAPLPGLADGGSWFNAPAPPAPRPSPQPAGSRAIKAATAAGSIPGCSINCSADGEARVTSSYRTR